VTPGVSELICTYSFAQEGDSMAQMVWLQ